MPPFKIFFPIPFPPRIAVSMDSYPDIPRSVLARCVPFFPSSEIGFPPSFPRAFSYMAHGVALEPVLAVSLSPTKAFLCSSPPLPSNFFRGKSPFFPLPVSFPPLEDDSILLSLQTIGTRSALRLPLLLPVPVVFTVAGFRRSLLARQSFFF